jgi:hypothetical protein
MFYTFFFLLPTAKGAIPPKRQRLSYYCFSYLHLEHLTIVESHLERVALASTGFARRIYSLFFFSIHRQMLPSVRHKRSSLLFCFFFLFSGAGALRLISFLS